MALTVIALIKAVPNEQAGQRINENTLCCLGRGRSFISEIDEYAVEAALQLKETRDVAGDKVVAVTMGSAAADSAAKKALQMGADSVIHVCDEALAASDAWVSSKVLAATVRNVLKRDDNADYIIMTGSVSPDGATGLVPVQVAARLEVPLLPRCSSIQLDSRQHTLRVASRNRGSVQELEAKLPVLISVAERIGRPRYPNFKNILAAKKKKVEVWGVEQLGLEVNSVGFEASLAKVRAVQRRTRRKTAVLVDVSAPDITAQEMKDATVRLVDFLAAQGLVAGERKT